MTDRRAEFRRVFARKRWVTDGAMATMLFAKRAPPGRPVEELNLLQPELVCEVHREYLDAGAEILKTNTFRANVDSSQIATQAAVSIAREVAKTQAFVAGTIGPAGVEDRAVFQQQAAALAGVDLFILETFRSVAELRAAVEGVRATAGEEAVIIAQVSVDRDGTLPGSLAGLNADAIGVNCSFGPESVFLAIEKMWGMGKLLSAAPSAGVGSTCSPEEFVRRFPRVHVAGGCCGTTPEHIRQLRAALH